MSDELLPEISMLSVREPANQSGSSFRVLKIIAQQTCESRFFVSVNSPIGFMCRCVLDRISSPFNLKVSSLSLWNVNSIVFVVRICVELRNLTHQIWVGNFRVNRWWFVIRDRESTRFNLLEVTSPDIRGEVCHSRIVAGHWRLGADHVRLLFAVVNHFTVERLGSDQWLSLKFLISRQTSGLSSTSKFWASSTCLPLRGAYKSSATISRFYLARALR